MRLEDFLHPDRVLILRAADRDDALRQVAAVAASATPSGPTAPEILAAILRREAQIPTSTPEGVAFPHAMLEHADSFLIVAALLNPPIPFGASAHPPSDLLFAIVGSSNRPWEHVRLLARLARIARAPGALDRLRAARDAADLHQRLLTEDRAHV